MGNLLCSAYIDSGLWYKPDICLYVHLKPVKSDTHAYQWLLAASHAVNSFLQPQVSLKIAVCVYCTYILPTHV